MVKVAEGKGSCFILAAFSIQRQHHLHNPEPFTHTHAPVCFFPSLDGTLFLEKCAL